MKLLINLAVFILTSHAMQSIAQSPVEKEIIQLSADKYRWYTENKIEQVEDLYDDGLVFVHLNGHISNKKEWIEQMHSGSFVYDQIILKEATAKFYGTTTVLVGKASFVVKGGSKYNLIYTEVYTMKNDKWKLVNIHTCSGYKIYLVKHFIPHKTFQLCKILY